MNKQRSGDVFPLDGGHESPFGLFSAIPAKLESMFAKKPTRSGIIGGLLAFVGMSAVAAVLIAAAVTPAIAVTGVTTNSALGVFDELPAYLKINDLAEKSSMYAKREDGSEVLLASFYAQNRITVPLEEISPFVVDAAIATEDPRFYEHGGVDLIGTARAIISNATGGDVQGGSSISQQYVKNILVMRAEEIADPEARKAAYYAATQTTIERKLKEMKLAISIESKYTKDEILNGYLNIASFGGRVYGIESASEYYFGVKAKDLTLAQAASLIATVNNPNNLRIDIPENVEYNEQRRNYVLGRMLTEGKITNKEYKAAVAEPVTPVITPSSTGCQTAGGAAFFCDYVTWIIKNDPAFGATEDERWAAFQRGGWKIMTTLDVELQAASETAIYERVPKIVPEGDIAGASVSVQVGTGRVLAMAQSKDYSADPEVVASGANYTSVNYNTDSKYGSSTGFPVGSTYKIFTLIEWLKQGHGLNEVVSGKVKDWKMSEFKNSCEPTGGPNWRPVNYAGAFDSTTTVMNALKNSYNLNFITMASKMDLCNIRKVAESFGVHRADQKTLKSNPSTIIGTEEIAPLAMAVATAGIANDGKTCTAIAIDEIIDYKGKKITPPKSKCTQSVTPAVARTTAYAMENVHSAGGTAARADVGDGIPWIAKTGTSDNAEQNWIMGSTSKVATVVWLGNVSGHVALSNVDFTNGRQYNTKQDIYRDIMTVANRQFGGDPFGAPDPNLVKGKSVSVPAIQGLTKEQAQALIESVGLTFTDGGEMDSELPLNTVAKSEPASGEPTAVGGEVKVYFSNQTLVAGPPSTVGMTETLARSTLVAAGWTVGATIELPIPDAQCPVPTPTPMPTPAPSPSTTACPGTANPLPVGQRLVTVQSPVGGFIKPTTPILITVQK